MSGIRIAIFISLVFIAISQICAHKIHKRLLESSIELPNKVTDLLNGTKLETSATTTIPSTKMFKEEETITGTSVQNWILVSSTEAPEILVHPFVEATEAHQSNESDLNFLWQASTDEKLQTENPRESKKTNLSAPGDTLSVLKPFQIIKENCNCFSILRPNSIKHTQKLENATTSMLSEVESEMGILFEIAAGVLPKVDEFIERNINKSPTNISQAAQANRSEMIEVKKDEPPLFEDFVPFFPLGSLLGRAMPHETIIIQTESDGVDPSKLLSDDFIQNGSTEIANTSTQKADRVDDKTPFSA